MGTRPGTSPLLCPPYFLKLKGFAASHGFARDEQNSRLILLLIFFNSPVFAARKTVRATNAQ